MARDVREVAEDMAYALGFMPVLITLVVIGVCRFACQNVVKFWQRIWQVN